MSECNTLKEKKHRHKWEIDACDCPSCGYSGQYFTCECGAVVDYDKKPFK